MAATEPSQPVRIVLRTNRVHSDIVDHAVQLQQRAGSVCALEYLRAYSILPHVIRRVLLHPELRRGPGDPTVMHKN